MRTLAEIAKLIGCPPPEQSQQTNITGMGTLAEAGPGDLSFIASDAFLRELRTSRAAAVIVQQRVNLPADWPRPALRVADADLAVARVLRLFAPPVPQPRPGIDASSRIAASALLADGVAIGPFVVVGERTNIGRNCVLHAGAVIGDDVTLGDDCQIYPHVVIRERITIGSRVIIHAGAVLGTDGFGYRWDGQQHTKVPQIGTVVIEDDVEIGSCVCIDRAKFSTTRVGRGTKIDNLVQIGHNVQVGPHCILVGQVGLAGSSRLGSNVVVGGQTAIRDHVTVGDGAMVAGASAVAEDVEPKTIVSGTPALPHRQSLREQAALRRLPELVVQVRKLQEEIAALQSKTQRPQ